MFHGYDFDYTMLRMPNVSKRRLATLPIESPPLKIQRKFGCRAAGVAQILQQLVANATELDTLFTSLQHRAFRGEP